MVPLFLLVLCVDFILLLFVLYSDISCFYLNVCFVQYLVTLILKGALYITFIYLLTYSHCNILLEFLQPFDIGMCSSY